jgi:hypothetical protein
MEEFTSISVWLLITFLMINATIVWFNDQPTFSDPTLGLGVPGILPNNTFSPQDVNNLQNAFYSGLDCSEVSAFDKDFGPCLIETIGGFLKPVTDAYNLTSSIFVMLWNFSTAWYHLLTAILTPLHGGLLFRDLLAIFFGGIQVMAILVLLLRVASIIRGTS